MRAMILAAGRGERMRPLTDTTPKPLLCVGGKPLIVWHIERLAAAGICDIVINHAWLGEHIESTLGNGDQFGVRLHYSAETAALETAGGIAWALPFFQNQPFLVINGDIWCDWNPADAGIYMQALQQHDACAWLLLVPNPPHHPDGDFLLDRPHDTNVHDGNREKASCPSGLPQPWSCVRLPSPPELAHPNAHPLTFSGIGIYQPALFSDVPANARMPLAPLLRAAINKKQVIGSLHSGNWVDVGTPARLTELDRRLKMQAPARYTSD